MSSNSRTRKLNTTSKSSKKADRKPRSRRRPRTVTLGQAWLSALADPFSKPSFRLGATGSGSTLAYGYYRTVVAADPSNAYGMAFGFPGLDRLAFLGLSTAPNVNFSFGSQAAQNNAYLSAYLGLARPMCLGLRLKYSGPATATPPILYGGLLRTEFQALDAIPFTNSNFTLGLPTTQIIDTLHVSSCWLPNDSAQVTEYGRISDQAGVGFNLPYVGWTDLLGGRIVLEAVYGFEAMPSSTSQSYGFTPSPDPRYSSQEVWNSYVKIPNRPLALVNSEPFSHFVGSGQSGYEAKIETEANPIPDMNSYQQVSSSGSIQDALRMGETMIDTGERVLDMSARVGQVLTGIAATGALLGARRVVNNHRPALPGA